MLMNDTTAAKTLDECQSMFDKANQFSELFLNGTLDNPDECTRVLNELTGVYLTLKPIHALAEAKKVNNELIFYKTRKQEVESKGEKFVSTSTEKEASLSVALYREIVYVLDAYLSGIEKALSTCQSVLKFKSEEMRMTKDLGQS
jgi:putative aminopeptidase FrvX